MAATETVREFFFRVSSSLNDISPQFTHCTERELVDWVNDGQRVICAFLPSACSRIDAVRLKPGTLQSIDAIAAADVLPGDGSTPAAVSGQSINHVVRNMGTSGTTPGSVVSIVARDVLDGFRPAWHTEVAGTSGIDHYIFDPRAPRSFYVYPGVPASRLWVEISYSANPTPIVQPSVAGQYGANGTDATKLSVDDKHVTDLFSYCIARAFMKQDKWANDPSRVNSAQQLFLSSINAQVQLVTGTNPNLTTLPFAESPIARAQ